MYIQQTLDIHDHPALNDSVFMFVYFQYANDVL